MTQMTELFLEVGESQNLLPRADCEQALFSSYLMLIFPGHTHTHSLLVSLSLLSCCLYYTPSLLLIPQFSAAHHHHFSFHFTTLHPLSPSLLSQVKSSSWHSFFKIIMLSSLPLPLFFCPFLH